MRKYTRHLVSRICGTAPYTTLFGGKSSSSLYMNSLVLSAAERSRLRPSVDVHALEHLLKAVPSGARLATFLAFVRDLTPADLVAAGVWSADDIAGPLDRIEVDTAAEMAPPSVDLQVHIDDPDVAALWALVEPRRG